MEDNTPNNVEIVVGLPSNRGKFIPYNELKDYMNKDVQTFRSMYLMDDSIYDVKSVKDYKGMYAIDRILFDFDLNDDGDKLMKEVLNFVESLIQRGASNEHIHVWFSGKGFHVIIPDYYGFEPSNNLPELLKETIQRDFKGYNIDPIYDSARIIRLEHTLNDKPESKRYKVPVTHTMLKECTYEQIQEYAINNDKRVSFYKYNNEEHIWADKKAKRIAPAKTDKPIKAKIGTKYNSNVTCVQKMADSSFPDGRNNTLMRMATVWKNVWGLSKEMATACARVAIPTLGESERNKMVARIYDDYDYKFRCDDKIMSAFCDSMCKFYKAKNFGVSVMSPAEIHQEYMKRLLDNSRTEFNLREVWDIGSDYIMEEGQFVVIIADTGVGKSAWLQNIAVALKQFSILYITLEVPNYLLIHRFFQIAYDQTYEEITTALREDNEIVNDYLESIKHVKIMETQPRIDSLKELIVDEQPDIVMVDTMDKIIVNGSNDPMRKMERISLDLQRIAVDTKTIMIGVSHISRGAVKDERGKRKPLDVHSAKDSSAIEQNADKLIMIDGTNKNPIKTISDGKTRTGNGFRVEMKMTGETLKYEVIGDVYGKSTQRVGRARIQG